MTSVGGVIEGGECVGVVIASRVGMSMRSGRLDDGGSVVMSDEGSACAGGAGTT